MWNKNPLEQTQRRITILFWIFLALLIVLSLRLWQLSVLERERYQLRSEQNRIRISPLSAPRGFIFDRNRQVLAEDLPNFTAVFVPGTVNLEEAISGLEQILGRTISTSPRERSSGEMVLVDNLTIEEVIRIEQAGEKLPGILIETFFARHYPLSEVTSHVVGYVGRVSAEELSQGKSADYSPDDFIGKNGVELFYEDILKGKKGYRRMEVNALGKVVSVLENVPPRFENSLVLTLDSEFQQFCYQLLEGKKGVILVGDPWTGEILVMVNRPAFDPNALSRGVTQEEWKEISLDPGFPLTNRAIQSLYPPGSLFKLLIAFSALEEGAVNEKSVFSCPGYLDYNDWRYWCWKRQGHGRVDLVSAIAQSCNVTFYNLGLAVGPDNIRNYAQQFYFGRPSGIDLPGEKNGFLPSPLWKRQNLGEFWFPGDTINLAIGQGYLLVTPFECWQMISLIATQGIKAKPHLLLKVLDAKGEEIWSFTPQIEDKIEAQPQTWNLIHQGMRQVVEQGTGYACRGLPVNGKTGTAQNPQGEDHSWFGGFFPREEPELAFLVLVEHGGDGSGEAAQLSRKIVEWWIKNRGGSE
ncbi:MAG: penicillin-binding protein 2 [Candidatus Atribacteria bacterium]|nr:penicillin-binding protein 2 [Candidatus Atribacteria bacterium]